MSTVRKPRHDYCFNPFNLSNHSFKRGRSLRRVTSRMLQKLKIQEIELSSTLMICIACHVKISKLPDPSESAHVEADTDQSAGCSTKCDVREESSSESNESRKSSDCAESSVADCIGKINESLVTLGETPIKKKKIFQKKYPKQKLQKIQQTLKKKNFSVEDEEEEEKISEENNDIIKKLKDRFENTDDRKIKLQILTIFQDWSYNKILEHFDASRHMINYAKKLAAEKGILSTPSAKPGKRLENTVVSKVLDYYASDEISRVMAGKKNYVSMKENGQKVQKQKRLMCNLKETYSHFKTEHPEVKIGFSKFADLRPKNCILPGAHGTHSVCVCSHHENVKLMIDGGNISKVTGNSEQPLTHYKDFLSQIMCNPPSPYCYFRKCPSCPEPEQLLNRLRDLYEENVIEEITYKQWVAVDRTNLEIIKSDVEEFLEKLSTKLQALAPHAFIAQQQTAFLRERKENLQKGECLVICDFSENYAFVIQDSVQGVHWNNDQATLHPFVIYFKQDDEIKHRNLIAISECLKHDTVAVHLFQRELISFINQEVGNVRKIIYFSDGASAQYKNRKNFVNTCYHESDFGIAAEWHFFATSHGKGPCDGIGGSTKRLATRASLQPLQDPITTPKKFFDWAVGNITNISFKFFSMNDYKMEYDFLKQRHEKTKPIRGTLTMHSFIPVSTNKALIKQYSAADEERLVVV